MSNRHYLINSEDLQNLNARLLSIAFSKDEGDWKSIMHTHHFTELLFVVSGEGSFSFNQEQSPGRSGHHPALHRTYRTFLSKSSAGILCARN